MQQVVYDFRNMLPVSKRTNSMEISQIYRSIIFNTIVTNYKKLTVHTWTEVPLKESTHVRPTDPRL